MPTLASSSTVLTAAARRGTTSNARSSRRLLVSSSSSSSCSSSWPERRSGTQSCANPSSRHFPQNQPHPRTTTYPLAVGTSTISSTYRNRTLFSSTTTAAIMVASTTARIQPPPQRITHHHHHPGIVGGRYAYLSTAQPDEPPSPPKDDENNTDSTTTAEEEDEEEQRSIFETLQEQSQTSSDAAADRIKIRADHLESSSEQQQQQQAEESSTIVGKEDPANANAAALIIQKRRRMRDVKIAEVLKAKHSTRWVEPVISRDATVQSAIVVCIERGLSGMMVIDDGNGTGPGGGGGDVLVDESIGEPDPLMRGGGPGGGGGGSSAIERTRGRVVGMITSRDLLRILAAGFREVDDEKEALASGKKQQKKQRRTEMDILHQTVENFMTPISQVIYARPEETIGIARTVMAKLGVKCLPILSHGRVEGLITARDLSEFGLDVTDRGGKKNFLRDVSERVGLSSNTSMADPPDYLRAHLALEQEPLFVNVGVAELPHPFKYADNGDIKDRDKHGHRQGGRSSNKPRPPSMDLEMSEDAHFLLEVQLPGGGGMDDDHHDEDEGDYSDSSSKPPPVVYCGVADGVGSWREYGVDPRLFSHRLMEECRNILIEAAAVSSGKQRKKKKTSLRRLHGGGSTTDGGIDGDVTTTSNLTGGATVAAVSPSEILAQAYERVKAENIIGSSTACVAMFDSIRHQLHFSNLGDSGIIVLRHIDSDVAGALKRDRSTRREERTNDLRVAFVSQQQLRSFNHPYQLGWTGQELTEGESVSFKNASDSCTSSIHVRRGDIIIMATDGLFDNVDIDEITQIALEWEHSNGFIRGGDTRSRLKRWEKGNSMSGLSAEVIPDLALKLCQTAREQSLDDSVDGPFAILAKENDIMWSGGMPDDCTVIAWHVVGRHPKDPFVRPRSS